MRNQKRTIWGLGIAVVIVTAGLIAWAMSVRRTDRTIVIGGVLPLTGDAATFGQNVQRGAVLAIQDANERKLGRGRQFEFKSQDSRGTATDAVAAAQTLLDSSRATMLVGDVTSAGTHALLPVVSRRAIPLVSPAASDPALGGKSEFFARVWPSDTYEAEVIGAHAQATGLKRIVAIFANTDYGIAMMDEFERVVGKMNFAAKIPTERQSLDYRPVVERIRLSNADALFLVLYPEDGRRLLQQLGEQSVALPLLATATIEDPSIAVLPEASRLVFASPAPPEEDDPRRKEFLRRYRERFGVDPGVLSDTGYDSTMILMEAYAACGRSSGQAIAQHIRGLSDYPGVSGRMSFDSKGNVQKPYRLKTVRDGKFTWVKP